MATDLGQDIGYDVCKRAMAAIRESEVGPIVTPEFLLQVELNRLIAQQARDDAGDFRHSSKREVLATDLGPNNEGQAVLNSKLDGGPPDRDWRPDPHRDDLGVTIVLMGVEPFEAWREARLHTDGLVYTRYQKALEARVEACAAKGEAVVVPKVCPVCKGEHAKAWDRYCLMCDACGKDGKVRYKGVPVGSMMRTSYKPDEDLKGGTG